MKSEESGKRLRGTAIIMRNGKVLLVRDKGYRTFSLPGGGMNKGEPAINTAVREIWEELGLVAIRVERMRECDYVGSACDHHVCLVEVEGDPHLRGHELDAFFWWDMIEPAAVRDHVKAILDKLRKSGKLERQ